MVMQFRSCCCGCTLRTGTIIIAVLGLLSGVSFIIEGIFPSDMAEPKTNKTMMAVAGLDSLDLHPTTLLPELDTDSGNGTDTNGDLVPGQHGFRVSQTIYGFLEFIICLLLLVGAIRNSAKLIYPWIFVSVVLCVLGIITFLGIGILVAVAGAVGLGVGYIIFGFIVTVIHVYFILVVNSFHSTLKAGPVSRA